MADGAEIAIAFLYHGYSKKTYHRVRDKEKPQPALPIYLITSQSMILSIREAILATKYGGTAPHSKYTKKNDIIRFA
ncbi:MAG: hypothetical protein WC028_16760 [Candidatus Obscuribacterales bacterium]